MEEPDSILAWSYYFVEWFCGVLVVFLVWGGGREGQVAVL